VLTPPFRPGKRLLRFAGTTQSTHGGKAALNASLAKARVHLSAPLAAEEWVPALGRDSGTRTVSSRGVGAELASGNPSPPRA